VPKPKTNFQENLNPPSQSHNETRRKATRKNHAHGAALGARVERTEPFWARACLAEKAIPSRGRGRRSWRQTRGDFWRRQTRGVNVTHLAAQADQISLPVGERAFDTAAQHC
jgi:hypothetical protein